MSSINTSDNENENSIIIVSETTNNVEKSNIVNQEESNNAVLEGNSENVLNSNEIETDLNINTESNITNDTIDNDELNNGISEISQESSEELFDSNSDEIKLRTTTDNATSYHVIFTYNGVTTHISGGYENDLKSILLSKIFSDLGININISDIKEITTSNSNIIGIEEVQNDSGETVDVKIISKNIFTSNENLTIEFNDENKEPIIIKVNSDIPEHYKVLTDNGNGTFTCEINSDNKVGNYTAGNAPIVMPINTPGYSAMEALTSYSSYEECYRRLT